MNYVSFVVGRLISPFDDRYIFSAVRTVVNIVVILIWFDMSLTGIQGQKELF